MSARQFGVFPNAVDIVPRRPVLIAIANVVLGVRPLQDDQHAANRDSSD
jgi:hypothetical protein